MHGFSDTLGPGWQRERMDNFQAIMLGRQVEEDLIDDGWTHHYAVVNNPPREKGMSLAAYIENAEAIDFRIMDEHRRRVEQLVEDPETAEILKPYYRYICKRPCFHDEYLSAYNNPNVSLIDCPAGFERITERGPVVDGVEYEVDTIIYGTGFEPERTPLYRRAGHEVVGRDGITLAEKWADGAVEPLRHDEPGLSQPVHHAGAHPAGRGDGELHPARRGGRRVRRGSHQAARQGRRRRLRRQRGGRGGLDEEGGRLLRRRHRR